MLGTDGAGSFVNRGLLMDSLASATNFPRISLCYSSKNSS
jgi:hypothetical protein